MGEEEGRGGVRVCAWVREGEVGCLYVAVTVAVRICVLSHAHV